MNKIISVLLIVLLSIVAVSAAPVTIQDGNLNLSKNLTIQGNEADSIHVKTSSGSSIFRIDALNDIMYTGLLRPRSDANYDVGQSSNRYKNAYFSGNVSASNVCYSNGTNCVATSDTNETIRFNALVNADCPGTDKVIGVYENGTVVCGSDVDTDTNKKGDGLYLTNDSTTIYFNETKLNQTIDLRDDDTTYTNGTGISLSGSTFSIILSYFQGLFIELTDSFGGDVSGTYNAVQITDNSHSLHWDNVTNKPNLDTNASDDLNASTLFGGDVYGTYDNLQVNGSLVSDVCLSNGSNCAPSAGSLGNTSEEMQDAAWNMTFDNECIITTYNDISNKTSLDINKTCVFQHQYKGLSSEGLVGYWTGDGYAFDSSGWNNDGYLTSGVTYTTESKFGKAFNFTWDDVYVRVPPHSSMNSNSTAIVAWIRPNSVSSSYAPIVTKNDSSANRPFSCWQNSQAVEIWFSSGGGNGAAQLTASGVLPSVDQWYHVICMYDASNKNLSIFVNGELKASGTHSTGPDTDSTKPIVIGYRGTSSPDFRGQIDEVMWWNRSLHWEEVQELYNSGRQFAPTQGTSAGEPFGVALQSSAGTSTTARIPIGGGSTEDSYTNHITWNGTHMIVSHSGSYEIEADASATCSTDTTFNFEFEKNGVDILSFPATVSCDSANDPNTNHLSYMLCLNSGDAISASVDSLTVNNIALQIGSSLKVKRVDKNCY